MLVLDTHVWIWFVNGEERLAKSKIFDRLDRAVRRREVGISAISMWELAMLQSKGKLVLADNLLEWMKGTTKEMGLKLLDLTPEIVVDSCQLPGDVHGDPADRLILATARIHQAELVTFDKEMLRYGKQGHVKVLG